MNKYQCKDHAHPLCVTLSQQGNGPTFHYTKISQHWCHLLSDTALLYGYCKGLEVDSSLFFSSLIDSNEFSLAKSKYQS